MTDYTSASGEHELKAQCSRCGAPVEEWSEDVISPNGQQFETFYQKYCPSPVDMTNLEKDINNRQYEYGILDTEHRLKADLAATVEGLIEKINQFKQEAHSAEQGAINHAYEMAIDEIRAHFSETGEHPLQKLADEMQDEPPEITKVIFDDLSETGE